MPTYPNGDNYMALRMDWLKLESRLRQVLRTYAQVEKPDLFQAQQALHTISDILGEETGRGFELIRSSTLEQERVKRLITAAMAKGQIDAGAVLARLKQKEAAS